MAFTRRALPFLLSLSTLTGSLLAAGAAHAEGGPSTDARAGADVIHLKTGGMIRGTLTELIPGDHATILLAGDQTSTVHWEAIARIEHAGTPTESPSSPGPDAATRAPRPPLGIGSVTVHIESERYVDLQELRYGATPASVQASDGERPRSADGGRRRARKEWISVCSSPCDRELPLDRTYRIAGSGVRRSTAFQLSGRAGERVTLDVDASSSSAFVGGIVLAGVGASFVILGGIVLAVGAAVHEQTVATAGGIALGAGVIAVVSGVIILVSNPSTKARQSTGAEVRRREEARVDPFLRAPTWLRSDGPAPSAAIALPLFTRAF